MKTPILRNTLLATLIAALSGGAAAAGLGRISVFSALGQPLRAEVEIAATPDEVESMSARIAPLEAFGRANIEYMGALSGVRMTIERRTGISAVVKITSDRAFTEPFVDMLVELNWTGGRLVREYTFLLDPSETPAQRPLPGVNEPVVRTNELPGTQQTKPVTPPTKEPMPAMTKPAATAPAAPAERIAKPSSASGDEYTVQKGDTLSSIAGTVKAGDVTQDQMLAALYQSNNAAFIGGNINRLRAGRILKVPQGEDVQRISKKEARQIVLKASNFDAYRQSVAAAAAAAPGKEPNAGQSSSGKIAPKVEEKAPTAASTKDQLKISKTQVGKPGEAGDRTNAGRVQALEEDIVARDKALKEANARAADLEKNVKELKKLLDMKSQSLADLQKQAAAAEVAAKEAVKKAQQAAKAQKPGAAETTPNSAMTKPVEQPPVAVPPPKPVEAVAATTPPPAEMAKPAEVPVAQTPPEPASAPIEAPKPPAVKEIIASPPPVVEEESLFKNPLAIGGIIVALLGAAYVVIRNRRRQPKGTGLTTSITETSASPNSVFGNAGGQTVDTGTSVLHTDFSQSGLSAIDTDEGVDPVAEADVYMAYGRDAQAEEILLDALKNDPTRTAVYVKLLEIYAQRRSTKQFENVATDLYTQTGGTGDDWAKAAALGIRLDPNNPLYRTSGAGVSVDTSRVAPPVAPAPMAPPPIVAAPVAPPAPVVPVAPVVQSPVYVDPPAPPPVTFGTNNTSQRATWSVPGEIAQYAGSDNSAPSIPQSAAPAAADLNLDFNLDLEMPEGGEPETEVELPKGPSSFTSSAPRAPAPVAAAPVPPMKFESNKSPETTQGHALRGAIDDHRSAATVPEGVAAFVSSHKDDADMGIEHAMQQTALSEVDLEKTNFEGNLLDFDFELGDEPAKPSGNDRSLDLSSVNLKPDARTTGGIAQPVRPAPKPIVVTSLEDDPIDSIDLDDEVGTKLELARAYEEMGDFEGARELLEEVVSDGAQQQKDQARTILSRIA